MMMMVMKTLKMQMVKRGKYKKTIKKLINRS